MPFLSETCVTTSQLLREGAYAEICSRRVWATALPKQTAPYIGSYLGQELNAVLERGEGGQGRGTAKGGVGDAFLLTHYPPETGLVSDVGLSVLHLGQKWAQRWDGCCLGEELQREAAGC